MTAKTLDEIAAEKGTDKSSVKVGPLSAKAYTRAYARYLDPVRDAPLVLLEIGIMDGRSLRTWEEYLPNARIFAIDIKPRCQIFESERTRVFIGDQTDPAFLKSVAEAAGAPFDCIIDDGGHRMEHHQASLPVLWPYLRNGGWYAIEDLHTCYEPRFGGGYLKPESTVETVLKPIIDTLNTREAPPPFVPGVESMHVYSRLAFLFKRLSSPARAGAGPAEA